MSTEWHQQSDIYRCNVWPRLLLPADSVRYNFIPFICRQRVPTLMNRTGRTTMTAALSKTERSILHGNIGCKRIRVTSAGLRKNGNMWKSLLGVSWWILSLGSSKAKNPRGRRLFHILYVRALGFSYIVSCDRWHITHDRWLVTCDTRRRVNILLNFKLSRFNGFNGSYDVLKIWRKRITRWSVNELQSCL